MLAGAVVTGKQGLKGFDANTTITRSSADLFYGKGYRFAIRYVRRDARHSFDLTEKEGEDILAGGLGLMVVQHVAPDGWTPTGEAGQLYGATAAKEASMAGVPDGVSLWCDLEGVSPTAPTQWVINYCNRWYSEVAYGGYLPGLYVGWHPGMNSVQLHDALRFKSYWAAYNNDVIPAMRGFQMRQHTEQTLGGITFDPNVITGDALGDFPCYLAPVCA